MRLLRFDHETHMVDLVDFFNLHNMNVPIDVPSIGFIVAEETTPIAVGFLRRCEGNYAIFDGLMTNPTMGPSLRDRALDILVGAILNEAKSLEINNIIGWIGDKNTLARASKFGFSTSGHTLIYKRIE